MLIRMLDKTTAGMLRTTGYGFVVLLGAVTGCASGPSVAPAKKEVAEIKSLWVKHHLVPCKGWTGQNYCYAVAEKPQGPWSLVKDGLENFYYQWGYSYRLLVTESVVGGSNSGKRVLKIQRKVPVQLGTAFDFSVDPQRVQTGLQPHLALNDGVGQILMGPTFTCDDRPVCDEIEARLRTEERFVVRFMYGVSGVRAVAVGDTGARAMDDGAAGEGATAATVSTASTLGPSARMPQQASKASAEGERLPIPEPTATAAAASTTVAADLAAVATSSAAPALSKTAGATVSADKPTIEGDDQAR